MQTGTHLIFGMAAFGKADQPSRTTAAFVGALLPDLSLYLLVLWHMWVLGTPENVIFGELYFSNAWQSVFRIDNSLVLWGLALALGFMARNAVVMALCGGALLHILLDLPLHHDDGRAHFWPISNWVFESPVSYWDPNHYGNIVAPIEAALAIAACVFLWRRHHGRWMRGFIAFLGVFAAGPIIAFSVMF